MDNFIACASIKTENVEYESEENTSLDQIGSVDIKYEILPTATYNKSAYSCTICMEKYNTPSELTKHKSIHLHDIISTFACYLSNPNEIQCQLCSSIMGYLPLAVLEMENIRNDGVLRMQNYEHNFDNVVDILESHKNNELTKSCELYSKIFNIKEPDNCFICGKICTNYLDLENHKLTHVLKYQPECVPEIAYSDVTIKLELPENDDTPETDNTKNVLLKLSNLDGECAREINEKSIKDICRDVQGVKGRKSRELSLLNLNQNDIQNIIEGSPRTYSLRQKSNTLYDASTKARNKLTQSEKPRKIRKYFNSNEKKSGTEKIGSSRATNLNKNSFEEIHHPSIVNYETKNNKIDRSNDQNLKISSIKSPILSQGSLILNDINISRPLCYPNRSITSQQKQNVPFVKTIVKKKCLKRTNTLVNDEKIILNKLTLNTAINQLCDTYKDFELTKNKSGNMDYLKQPNQKKIKLSDSVNLINGIVCTKQRNDPEEYIVIVAKDKNDCVPEANRKSCTIETLELPTLKLQDWCKSPGSEIDCTEELDPLRDEFNIDPTSLFGDPVDKIETNIGSIIDGNFHVNNKPISEVDQITTRMFTSVKDKNNFNAIDQRKLFMNIKEKVRRKLNKNTLNVQSSDNKLTKKGTNLSLKEKALLNKQISQINSVDKGVCNEKIDSLATGTIDESHKNFYANQLVIHQFFNLSFWDENTNKNKLLEETSFKAVKQKNKTESISDFGAESIDADNVNENHPSTNTTTKIDDVNEHFLKHKTCQSKQRKQRTVSKSKPSKYKKTGSDDPTKEGDNEASDDIKMESTPDEHLVTKAIKCDVNNDDISEAAKNVSIEEIQVVDLDSGNVLNEDGYSTDDEVPLSVLSGIYKHRRKLIKRKRIEYVTYSRVENVANIGEEPMLFGMKWSLEMKVLNKSGNKLRCGKCKQIVYRNMAVQHIKKHAEYKRYACNICGELFTTATVMTLHRTQCCIIAQQKPKRRKFKNDLKMQKSKKTDKKKSRRILEPPKPTKMECIACAEFSEYINKYYCYSCNMRFTAPKRFNRHKKSMTHKLMVIEDIKKFFTWDEVHDFYFDNDDKLLDGDLMNIVKEVWLDNFTFTMNFGMDEFESRMKQLDCSENSDTWLMISRAERKSKRKCYLCAKHITHFSTHQKTIIHEKMVEWQVKKSLHFTLIHNEENIRSYNKTYVPIATTNKSLYLENETSSNRNIQENSQVNIENGILEPHKVLNTTYKKEPYEPADKTLIKRSTLRIAARKGEQSTIETSHGDVDASPDAKCQICSIVVKKHGMINHIKHHLENRAFHCNVCHKSFIHKSNFISHKTSLIHKNNVSINKCVLQDDADQYCQKKMTYKQHTCSYKTKHTSGNKYFCNRCTKEFQNRACFNRHYRYYHATSLKCQVCSRRFCNRVKLAMHLESHQIVRLKCTFCSRTYSSKTHIMGHLRKFHEKDLVTSSAWYERMV